MQDTSDKSVIAASTKLVDHGDILDGATQSTLVICDERGAVVGCSSGPGTNHWNIGFEECAHRILTMLRTAKKDAGLPSDKPLDSLGLALSGCEQTSSNLELAAVIKKKELESARVIHVASDTAGSLATAAPLGGMVLIAGTGSNALLQTVEGEQRGCGGWGYLMSDEGSAYWMAHRAVKMVFDHLDGLRLSPHTIDKVWHIIKKHFDIQTQADMMQHTHNNFNKTFFSGMTQKLSLLAVEGDKLAQHIFADAGSALGSLIATLAKQSNTDRLRVVCVGSVWGSWDLLKPGTLTELKLREVTTELELVRLKVSSAIGAARLGAQLIKFELPRDDAEFCQVFYTYRPVPNKIVDVECSQVEITVENDSDRLCGCINWVTWTK